LISSIEFPAKKNFQPKNQVQRRKNALIQLAVASEVYIVVVVCCLFTVLRSHSSTY